MVRALMVETWLSTISDKVHENSFKRHKIIFSKVSYTFVGLSFLMLVPFIKISLKIK